MQWINNCIWCVWNQTNWWFYDRHSKTVITINLCKYGQIDICTAFQRDLLHIGNYSRTHTQSHKNRIPLSCNPTEIYLKNRIKVIENSWNITQEDPNIERHISTVTIQKYNNMHACVCSFFEKYSIFKMLKVDLSWIIAEMSYGPAYGQRVYARVVFPLSFIVNLCGFFIGSLRHVHI